ncbi:hypothetical protein [Bartonella rattimassiliensis]|uniref:Uncharacterized protein n=1 Tax=Bartonella rattimassiliensis 15908 TaxID=1094556 RepID=J1JIE0_9HYPH|nr:hypothetical protein [Bartonella rattimassiliensis]EJF84362.1 hypothetical protein MCY_01169 [Bartonella rattimassiliensis 15908]
MLLSYLKRIALFGMISILFTGHVSSKPLTNDNYSYGKYIEALCPDGQIPVLRDVQNPSSFITCVDSKEAGPIIVAKNGVKFRVFALNEKHYEEILERRFKKARIIQCFVIGFIIITIMSLPINILWRFRLKIPAFLFTIMTALAVIAIPFIFY